MSVIRRAWNLVLGAALTAIIGLLLALVAVPLALGWMPLTVLSGSMEPTIPTGSQVVVDPVAPEEMGRLNTGDVITFMPYPDDPTLITHRITGVALDATGQPSFTTQGDHNPTADAESVAPAQIRGVVRYHVPWAGYLATILDPEQKRLGVILVAAALAAYAVWHAAQAARHHRRPASPPVGDFEALP